MMMRASLRSTRTPAIALKTTAGTRKVRIRTALAVFEPVAITTVAIKPASTMLLASWLSSCATHSSTKLRFAEDAAGDRQVLAADVAAAARARSPRRPAGRARGAPV